MLLLLQVYLIIVDGDDPREDNPGDSFDAGWGGQASRVGEVVAPVDGLEELAEVDVATELRVGLFDALQSIRSVLKCKC